MLVRNREPSNVVNRQNQAGDQHQDRPAAKAAEKDPPYLAQLLKDYPTLTKEKALEMIRDAGG
jgi:hypothetical protein